MEQQYLTHVKHLIEMTGAIVKELRSEDTYDDGLDKYKDNSALLHTNENQLIQQHSPNKSTQQTLLHVRARFELYCQSFLKANDLLAVKNNNIMDFIALGVNGVVTQNPLDKDVIEVKRALMTLPFNLTDLTLRSRL